MTRRRPNRITGLLGMLMCCLGLALPTSGRPGPIQERFLDAVALLDRPDIRYQEQMGQITTVLAPDGRPEKVIQALAGPKKDGRVGKAGLILPFAALGPGKKISIEAEFFFPQNGLRNSIHLMDLECKHCGAAGNPGLRLYLRHGRVRIDRKKIKGGKAWVNDQAPVVREGAWNRIRWDLDLGTDALPGRSVVVLNGEQVLDNSGRTLPDVAPEDAAIDRLQIGVTANSNDTAATVFLGALSITRSD